MGKLRKYKLSRIVIGIVLGFFTFVLFTSLFNFVQYPQYSTLFVVLFSVFGFFFALWYTLSDLGYLLNVTQHRNLAKKGTFFITENKEHRQDHDFEETLNVEDYFIVDTAKLAKIPQATGAATKEILDEIHDFLDKRYEKN